VAGTVDWDHSDKRRELSTYRALHLDRATKSRAARERTDRARLFRTIGSGTTERPYLLVPRTEYLRVWREVQRETGAGKGISSDVQRQELERRVYDLLALQTGRVKVLANSFRRGHGRDMTPHEQALYGRELARDAGKVAATPTQRAALQRKIAVQDLLRKIESAQADEPIRLGEIWMKVAGPEAAAESHLEKVERQEGLAIVRCINSSCIYNLRRKRDLPAKLSKALGVEIKRIAFR
jgi:hypothetical protein